MAFPGWLYWLMPLVVSLTLFALAAFVLRAGQPTIYNRVFFALYATSALKSLTESLAVLGRGQAPSLLEVAAAKLYPLTAYLLIPLFLWFVLVFPRPVHAWLAQGGRGALTLLLAVPFVLNDVFHLLPWIRSVNAFNAYASMAGLLALGLLVYHAWETDGAEERLRIRLLAATFSLVVFSTIVVTLLTQAATRALRRGDEAAFDLLFPRVEAFSLVVTPLLELVGATILMYAILRYQVLGVEVVVKRATRTSLMAAALGTVFVVISNSVEQVFQITVLKGVRFDFILAGFIATGLLLPVQKGTDRLANRLFPDAGSKDPRHLADRRIEIYEAQLRYALLDGTLKEKELAMLRNLREALQMPLEELTRLLQRFPNVDARILLGAVAPATPATPTSA